LEDYQLLIDLHQRANRQGPGGDKETGKAIDLAMINPSAPLLIADIGCGTGSSALLLARLLNAGLRQWTFCLIFSKYLKSNPTTR
jgi:precorrin-6B methylase 2